MQKIKEYGTIFLPILLGGVVSLIISPSMDYNSLKRPFLSPPDIVFPIAWSILYLLLGISEFIVKREGKIDHGTYYINLFVNLMWPIIFFSFKLYFLAFLWILLLLIWTVKLLKEWKMVSILAYRLQIPYFLWLLFATYLNIGVALLN